MKLEITEDDIERACLTIVAVCLILCLGSCWAARDNYDHEERMRKPVSAEGSR